MQMPPVLVAACMTFTKTLSLACATNFCPLKILLGSSSGRRLALSLTTVGKVKLQELPNKMCANSPFHLLIVCFPNFHSSLHDVVDGHGMPIQPFPASTSCLGNITPNSNLFFVPSITDKVASKKLEKGQCATASPSIRQNPNPTNLQKPTVSHHATLRQKHFESKAHRQSCHLLPACW
jgi:hypothetical protein